MNSYSACDTNLKTVLLTSFIQVACICFRHAVVFDTVGLSQPMIVPQGKAYVPHLNNCTAITIPDNGVFYEEIVGVP